MKHWHLKIHKTYKPFTIIILHSTDTYNIHIHTYHWISKMLNEHLSLNSTLLV